MRTYFLMLQLIIVNISMEAKTIHQWEVLNLIFNSAKVIPNPYAQINESEDLLTVTFECINGDSAGKRITIAGFWNGNTEWCVNFAPPCTGKWKYKSSSSDRQMNGKSGDFDVIAWTSEEKELNPTRRGFIRNRKAGENRNRYFEYSDGTPFLWIGDTWWNWTKKDADFSIFKELVNDRKKRF